ncbi:MAG TPA: hypothetical protein PLI90_10015 [Rhodocyclaceae bacterium]|mgnify:CR=1 FL=1|nr:hypothetical protein [Rhodocyclaceae bacterium]
MTTIQIELPDATAQAARDAGLLTSQALDRLLNNALRHKATDDLFSKMDELADANYPEMTLDQIQSEVDAYRAEQRSQAAG